MSRIYRHDSNLYLCFVFFFRKAILYDHTRLLYCYLPHLGKINLLDVAVYNLCRLHGGNNLWKNWGVNSTSVDEWPQQDIILRARRQVLWSGILCYVLLTFSDFIHICVWIPTCDKCLVLCKRCTYRYKSTSYLRGFYFQKQTTPKMFIVHIVTFTLHLKVKLYFILLAFLLEDQLRIRICNNTNFWKRRVNIRKTRNFLEKKHDWMYSFTNFYERKSV